MIITIIIIIITICSIYYKPRKSVKVQKITMFKPEKNWIKCDLICSSCEFDCYDNMVKVLKIQATLQKS